MDPTDSRKAIAVPPGPAKPVPTTSLRGRFPEVFRAAWPLFKDWAGWFRGRPEEG
jgi:hypothetical protein